MKLEEEENRRRATPDASGDTFASRGGTSRGGSAMDLFSANQSEVELIECKQVGQTIEVRLRIKNIGPDLDFLVYGGRYGSRVIDTNNSNDYWASQVSVGTLTNHSYVKKTLITNNPVEAKIIFSGVAEDVSTLAKIQIKCHGHGGDFFIEYRDIRVD